MSQSVPRGGPGAFGTSGYVEKPKNLKKALAKILRYCLRYGKSILFALMAVIMGTVLQILGPDRIRALTEEIQQVFATGRIDMKAVGGIVTVLLCFMVGTAVLSLLQHVIMATVTAKMSHNLREDISEKINRLPLKYFDKSSYGDILSRVVNDVDTIASTLNQSIGNLTAAVTLLIGSLVMMFYTNWVLALTTVSTSFLGFIAVRLIMKHSQKYFVNQQQSLGDLNGHVEEIFSGLHVVKVYNGGKRARTEFEVHNGRLFSSAWKSQFFSGLMMPLMGLVGNIGYVAICVVGAAIALKDASFFAVIIAFMLYIRQFTQPLTQITQAAQNLQRAAAASERVFSFFEEGELSDETEKPAVLPAVSGEVVFQNVKFGYDPEKPIIHGFSSHIKAGQRVAIVGPTGAGKTTMVNLLMRFYELDGGEIRLDGVPINRVTRETVREQFCMVLQDTWLFEGTLRENLIYNKAGITEEQMVAVCKSVGLHHFIQTMPEGYDTVLNDKANISEGQKQLVTIVRAMLRNAPLIILDEATSSVDTRTEIIIQHAMEKLMQGRTSFVIAHRLSTIRNADVILVMRDGSIVESGNHKTLLAEGGFYSELYNAQFENVG